MQEIFIIYTRVHLSKSKTYKIFDMLKIYDLMIQILITKNFITVKFEW